MFKGLWVLITNGMKCTRYNWLNKGYSFYFAAVVIISGGCGLKIEVLRKNQPNKKFKMALFF